MAQCVTTPTATQTELRTVESLTTTVSLATTTLDPVTSFQTVTSCTLSVLGACAGSTEIISTTTIPGATSTITSSVVLTSFSTSTDLRTLFATACSDPSTPPPGSRPTSTSSNPIPDPVTTPSGTTTLPNGQISTIFVTMPPTTNPATQPSQPSTTSPLPGPATDSSGASTQPANLGAIIGGTVGGVAGIIAICLIVWFVLKRRRRWDDIFDKEDANAPSGGQNSGSRFSLGQDLEPVEPKPYQYGLVGHVTSPSATSPPNSPPLGATARLSNERGGYMPNQAFANYAHNQPQIAPLHLPQGMVASIPSGPTTMSSRPSTAGSTQALNAAPPLPQNQFGQQNVQNPRLQYSNSATTTSSYSQNGHSQAGSITQPPLQHNSSWAIAAAMPTPPAQDQEQEIAFDPYQQYRSGSPSSMQEAPRRLHVANQNRDSMQSARTPGPASPTPWEHERTMSPSSVPMTTRTAA